MRAVGGVRIARGQTVGRARCSSKSECRWPRSDPAGRLAKCRDPRRREELHGDDSAERDDQPLRALEEANRVRLARAQLKREIATGGLSASAVIECCPTEASGMAIDELLRSQPRWGPAWCSRVLTSVGVSEPRPLGALTERQRRMRRRQGPRVGAPHEARGGRTGGPGDRVGQGHHPLPDVSATAGTPTGGYTAAAHPTSGVSTEPRQRTECRTTTSRSKLLPLARGPSHNWTATSGARAIPQRRVLSLSREGGKRPPCMPAERPLLRVGRQNSMRSAVESTLSPRLPLPVAHATLRSKRDYSAPRSHPGRVERSSAESS